MTGATFLTIFNLVIQVILAIGVALLLLQLKNQIKNDRYNRTFQQVSRLEEREFRVIRKSISEWDGNYPSVGEDANDSIREFSHTLDTIGALYAKGYLDTELMLDLYGGFIIESWYKFQNFVKYEKECRKYKRYQEYFKIMAKDIETRYHRKYPSEGTSPSQ